MQAAGSRLARGAWRQLSGGEGREKKRQAEPEPGPGHGRTAAASERARQGAGGQEGACGGKIRGIRGGRTNNHSKPLAPSGSISQAVSLVSRTWNPRNARGKGGKEEADDARDVSGAKASGRGRKDGREAKGAWLPNCVQECVGGWCARLETPSAKSSQGQGADRQAGQVRGRAQTGRQPLACSSLRRLCICSALATYTVCP